MFISSEHEQKCGDQVNITNADSCQFYINCIERHFPCLENGFAIGYAEKRCQAILSEHRKESSTFRSPHIRRWAINHETCLRGKLLHLLQTFFNNSRPDQPVCLQMETLAFKAVEECYNETHEEFCPSDSNGLTLDSNDSSLIAQMFSLNNKYYEYTVHQGLTRLLSACNHSSADAASQSLDNQAPRTVVICAKHFNSDLEINNPLLPSTEYIQNMSRLPRRRVPSNQLVYGGYILHTENTEGVRRARECYNHDRSYVNPGRVHLLLWSVPPEVPVQFPLFDLLHFDRGEQLEIWSTEKLHSRGECGDGVRQATEMCDSGVFSGEEYGCTADCRSLDGFECSSDPLTRSECYKQICGDGMRTSDEECDNKNGDGCVNCTVQPGWNCSGDYRKLSLCTQTPTTEPPTTTSECPPSEPNETFSTPSAPPIGVPDSAGTTSTHLVIVVASVIIALVVSGGLSSTLPDRGDGGSSEVLHITSISRQGQRGKPEEVLNASARPCQSEAWDCISRCIPHEVPQWQ